MQKIGDFFAAILNIIFSAYAIGTQISALYFWWLMAKEDSFLMTIFVDPFIAEIKGFLWPFFI